MTSAMAGSTREGNVAEFRSAISMHAAPVKGFTGCELGVIAELRNGFQSNSLKEL
jgi:hypothetical protein